MTAWIVLGGLVLLGAAAVAWAFNADDAGHGEGE